VSRTFALWAGVLTAPIVWLCTFQARFAWVPWACTFQAKLVLFLIALLGLLLNGGAALIAWREWKAIGAVVPGEEGGALPRSRFMAISGIAFSAAFSLVIVAQTIPELILGSCE